MFSKSIIDSDAFLDMPATTQMLYFHLAMRADDDGFIDNPKRIQRTVGASDDDMKVLIAKSFIIPFDSGIVVIKHWKIHNYIAKDRYTPTRYTEEKSALEVDENRVYQPSYTNCIQTVYEPYTDCTRSIDKNSKDKRRIDKSSKDMVIELVDDHDMWFKEFWKAYPRKVAKANAEKVFKKKCKDSDTFLLIMNGLKNYVQACKGKDAQYIAHPATWLNGERWNDEVAPVRSGNSFIDMLKEIDDDITGDD